MTGPKAMSREQAKALGKANKAAATGHRSGVGEGTRGQERTPSTHPASEALKLGAWQCCLSTQSGHSIFIYLSI